MARTLVECPHTLPQKLDWPIENRQSSRESILAFEQWSPTHTHTEIPKENTKIIQVHSYDNNMYEAKMIMSIGDAALLCYATDQAKTDAE